MKEIAGEQTNPQTAPARSTRLF